MLAWASDPAISWRQRRHQRKWIMNRATSAAGHWQTGAAGIGESCFERFNFEEFARDAPGSHLQKKGRR